MKKLDMADPELEALITEMDAELLDVVYRDEVFPSGQVLHHYTDSAGLLGILEHKALRATHFRYLNDREELVGGERCIQELAKELATRGGISDRHRAMLELFIEQHEQNSLTKVVEVFVASLSESENQLSQWRAYGANGAGYSIGLADVMLPKGGSETAALAIGFFKCEYDVNVFKDLARAKIEATLALIDRVAQRGHPRPSPISIARAGTGTLLRGMAGLVPKLKDAAFREEKEWRLIAMPFPGREKDVVQFRPGARGIIPYVDVRLTADLALLDLDCIYVGPTQDPDAGRLAANLLLDKRGYVDAGQKVKCSRIPFVG